MQFTVHAAKTQLSKLIAAALAGEDVVIARGAKPVVRIVPIPQSGFRLGIRDGTVSALPDFLAPMPEDDLQDWERGN